MAYQSKSEQDTVRLAADLAERVAPGDIVCLQGDLGSGKSVFARALIRTLCGDPALEVPSPTFTLVQSYDAAMGDIWHFDLYRLEDADEIYELGWEEALAGGIVIVEWPERLGTLVPPDRLTLFFETGSARDERLISPETHGTMQARWGRKV